MENITPENKTTALDRAWDSIKTAVVSYEKKETLSHPMQMNKEVASLSHETKSRYYPQT